MLYTNNRIMNVFIYKTKYMSIYVMCISSQNYAGGGGVLYIFRIFLHPQHRVMNTACGWTLRQYKLGLLSMLSLWIRRNPSSHGVNRVEPEVQQKLNP